MPEGVTLLEDCTDGLGGLFGDVVMWVVPKLSVPQAHNNYLSKQSQHIRLGYRTDSHLSIGVSISSLTQ